MSVLIRGERWELGYGIEATAGTAVTADSLFGVFEKATLADPEIEYMPFWGLADGAGRTYTIAYKGKWTMNASISDVLLLNGGPLQLPLGAYSNGAGTAAPYTHTSTGTTELPSITMFATFWDSDGTAALKRRWVGGKVNKAGFTAEEGGQLKMSVDEIMFLDFEHDSTYATGVKYSAALTSPTLTIPTTEPYYFSQGSLSLNGTTFCRIKSFKIDINNNCEPKYYICNPSGTSGNIPNEIIEGKREIGFTCTVDVGDTKLYGELLNEGTYSSVFKGFDISLVFTRGSGDTITFTMPPATSATGTHAQGCLIKKGNLDITGDPVVAQELDILVRDIKIVTVDSVASYA